VFAATSLVVGATLFALAWRSAPLIWTKPSSLWLAAVLVAVGLAGVAAPRAVRHIYKIAMFITRPIGFVVAQVMLAILYFLVVVPLALVLRLTNYDPLQRKPPGRWIPVSRKAESKRRYLRQY